METTIIHPTDFSKCADRALEYAIVIAKALKLDIKLVHSIDFDAHAEYAESGKSMIERTKKAEEIVEKKLQDLGSKVQNEGIVCTASILTGRITESLPGYLKRNPSIGTIMGTTGAGSLRNKIIGSNAFAIIKDSKQPVIAIPEHAKATTFSNFVYLSELNGKDREALKEFTELAESVQASIEVIHFSNEMNVEKQQKEEVKMSATIEKKYADIVYDKISYQLHFTSDTHQSIRKFSEKLNPDLLGIAMRKQNFIQRLFKGSLTETMVNQSNLPMIIYPS